MLKTILKILALTGLLVPSAFGQSVDFEKKKYSNLYELYPSDTLTRIFKGNIYQLGVPSGYVNQHGDTVIPIGKYQYCFLDTVTTYAIVGDSSDVYGIDQKENRLYEVYWFDNGPDDLKYGLFRIIRNGKIGYANQKGQIVIKPQFDCANQFKNGIAKVTFDCVLQKDGEYITMQSDNWIYIDKSGKKLKWKTTSQHKP